MELSLTIWKRFPFHFRDTPIPVLIARFGDAWDAVVTEHIRSRDGFADWREFDLRASSNLKLPVPDDNRIAANIENLRCVGALYGSQREQWQDTEHWQN